MMLLTMASLNAPEKSGCSDFFICKWLGQGWSDYVTMGAGKLQLSFSDRCTLAAVNRSLQSLGCLEPSIAFTSKGFQGGCATVYDELDIFNVIAWRQGPHEWHTP